MPSPIPGKAPDPATASPLAGSNAQGQPPVAAAAPHAKVTVAKHGGNSGGKPREDGLVPGSKAAIEADRAKDAKRKRDERKQRKVDQAPLPSAQPGISPTQAPAPGVAPLPGDPALQVVAWQAEDVKPAVDLTVPVIEELLSKQLGKKAAKARLAPELIAQVQKDCAWPRAARDGIQSSGSKVVAKWLNKMNVPAGAKEEVAFLTAAALIASQHFMAMRRLDALIERANVATKVPDQKPPEPKPEEKKP